MVPRQTIHRQSAQSQTQGVVTCARTPVFFVGSFERLSILTRVPALTRPRQSRAGRCGHALLLALLATTLLLGVVPPAHAASDDRLGAGYGVVISGGGDHLDDELNRVADAGLDWFELPMHWAWLQPHDASQLRWKETGYELIKRSAQAHHLRILLRLIDPPQWAGGRPAAATPDQVAQVLVRVDQQLDGVPHAFQVFNEPNLPIEWGGPPDPPLLVRQLTAASTALRAGHSQAIVVSPAMAPATGRGGGSFEDVEYLTAAYRAGLRGAVDAVGSQAYGGNFPPNADPTTCSPLCFRRVELYRAIMESFADHDTKLWATEMGWLADSGQSLPGFDWMKVSTDDQAAYLAGAMQYARDHWPWLGGMFVFNLDFALTLPDSEQMSWFSLVDHGGQPRKAYRALAALTKVPPLAVAVVPTPLPVLVLPPPAKAPEPAPVPDLVPHFANGFATLKTALGNPMGDPIDQERQSASNGDTLQHTSTGLVFYRKATNTPTFTDGYRHWALTAGGLITWTGASVDPPTAVLDEQTQEMPLPQAQDSLLLPQD